MSPIAVSPPQLRQITSPQAKTPLYLTQGAATAASVGTMAQETATTSLLLLRLLLLIPLPARPTEEGQFVHPLLPST